MPPFIVSADFSEESALQVTLRLTDHAKFEESLCDSMDTNTEKEKVVFILISSVPFEVQSSKWHPL